MRRPQIYIEALIVEVTADKAAEFGIQWQDFNGLSKSGSNIIGGTNFNGATAGSNIISASNLTGGIGLTGVGQGLNIGLVRGTVTIGGIADPQPRRARTRARTDNNANVLSTPNLMTLDNEEAQIIVAQNIPVPNGQFAQITVGSSSLVTTFDRRDVGITLKIKPTFSDNGTVKLLIYQEVSNVIQSTLSSTNGPSFTKRSVSTVVQPDEDELVVLGRPHPGPGREQHEPGAGARQHPVPRLAVPLPDAHPLAHEPDGVPAAARDPRRGEQVGLRREVRHDPQGADRRAGAAHAAAAGPARHRSCRRVRRSRRPGVPAPYQSPEPPPSPSLPNLKQPLE